MTPSTDAFDPDAPDGGGVRRTLASIRREPRPSVPWEGRGTDTPIGVPLVDLLDRVLATGVVVCGDIVLAIADVPLIRLSLHALLASVSDRVPAPWKDGGPL